MDDMGGTTPAQIARIEEALTKMEQNAYEIQAEAAEKKAHEFIEERAIPKITEQARRSIITDSEAEALAAIPDKVALNPYLVPAIFPWLVDFSSRLFFDYAELIEENKKIREKVDALVVQLIKSKMERVGLARAF